jgi:hypothetical protein
MAMEGYNMQTHSDSSLLDQLNKLPSPSSLDPHTNTAVSSDNSLSNPFEAEVRIHSIFLTYTDYLYKQFIHQPSSFR